MSEQIMTPTLFKPPMQVGTGDQSALNIVAATVVKVGPGRVARIAVVSAGSDAGAVHDCVSTGAAGAANQVASIPNTVGVIELDWPLVEGLVVVPGSGQVLAVSFA